MKLDDLSGTRFGLLVVLGRGRRKGQGGKSIYWLCKCECGTVKEIVSGNLKNGHTRSCGCLKSDLSFKNLRGKRFGRLLIIEPTTIGGSSGTKWKCRCDCGNVKEIKINGKTKSCGCLQKEITKKIFTKSYEELKSSSFNNYLRHIKGSSASSKRRAVLPITITEADLKEQWEKQHGVCPYTGWKMDLKIKHRYGPSTPKQASVDRIDNSRGYSKDNIQFVSLMSNYAKNQFDEEALIYFCKAVARHHPDVRFATREEKERIEQRVVLMDEMGL